MRETREIQSWIQREQGFSSPSDWVRFMANRFHTESGQTSPPVLLEKILRNKNIDVQFVPHLEVEGRLICKQRGFTVLLNDRLRLYRARARFTTAHELGHTLFYDWSSPTPCRAVPRSFNNPFEELICNAFAGELLIPFEYLLAEGRGFQEKSEPEKASVLQKVATTCAVAREVAACHLVRTLRWWDSILIFTAQAGKRGPRDTFDRTRRIIWSWHPPQLDGKLYIPGNRTAYPKIKIAELQQAAEGAEEGPRLQSFRSRQLKIGNLSTVLDRLIGDETQVWAIRPSLDTQTRMYESTAETREVLLVIPLFRQAAA